MSTVVATLIAVVILLFSATGLLLNSAAILSAQPTSIPTITPSPQADSLFPVPMGVWATYTDPKLNYSFKYPSTWFIDSEPDTDTIYLHNISPNAVDDYLEPRRIKIIISPQKDVLTGYASFQDYLNDPRYAVSPEKWLYPPTLVTLENGYQIATQTTNAPESNDGILIGYVTNGEDVITFAVYSLKAQSLHVVDDIFPSVRFDNTPRTIVTAPAPSETSPVASPFPSPDLTAFAAVCCPDDKTPIVATPSIEQAAVWTANAVKPTVDPQVLLYTETPLPILSYPAPSDEWLDHYDTNFGINFKYPSNWFVEFTVREVAITNYPLLDINYIKSYRTDPYAIRINIVPLRDLNLHESLSAYIIAINPNATFLEQQPAVRLENGLQAVRVIHSQKGTDRRWSVTYLTNGTQVFEVISEYGEMYASVQDELVKTISLTQAQTEGTATPMPTTQLGELLPPSGQWRRYTKPNVGYSFEYPDNWLVTNDGSATLITNVSPGTPPKFSQNFLSIWIGPVVKIKEVGSIDTYINDPVRAVPADWIFSQKRETLPNGYQLLWREQKMLVGSGAIYIYLANETHLYEIHVNERNSPYLDVVDHLLATFTAVTLPTTPTPQPSGDTQLVGDWMVPSNEWAIYDNREYGFKFMYPANFTVLDDNLPHQINITNHPLGHADPSNRERFSVLIGDSDKTIPGQSLDEFIDSRGDLDKEIQRSPIQLGQGYSGIKVVSWPYFEIEPNLTVIYIERGSIVYVIVFPDSVYGYLYPRILDSLVLPE
jgi:hypothetical protein